MQKTINISTVEQLIDLDPAPCAEALAWLAANGITDLAEAWDRCHRADWMLWLDGALDLLTVGERRLIACRFVRETPLSDGRKVWDLLTDERSRQAVAVAERHARGDATDEQLAVAWATARAARTAAEAAARAARTAADAAATAVRAEAWLAADAAEAAARAAARAATDEQTAARAATWAAQADLIREIAGNPWQS